MDYSEIDPIDEVSGNDGSVGVYVQENNSNKKSIQFWSLEETKYMMELYEECICKVGPLKRFRIKKIMWAHMAKVMAEKFNRHFSGIQVENRYKNEKRKKHNRYEKKSKPRDITFYDNEIESSVDIKNFETTKSEIMSETPSVKESLDDYYNSKEIPMVENSPILLPGTNENIIMKYMQQKQEIYKQKEERKQRRHEEKIIVLKSIGESLQRLLERKRKYTN